MYKTKLQELCQKRSWELPEYTTVRDGPSHMPRFTATVNVRGQGFQTPVHCKSSKDAQNTAAKIAFDHFNISPPTATSPAVDPQFHSSASSPSTVNWQFQPDASIPITTPTPQVQPIATVSSILPLSPLPSSLPNPPPGLLAITNDANTKPSPEEILQDNCEDTQPSVVNTVAIGSHDKCYKDKLHIYKNQLQQYAQKENLGFPVYTTEADGPPHARRFKSRVSVGGKSYETLEFFPTLKEAEQAVARVACEALSVEFQEDGGLYKNLLQEFAQRKGFLCPSYMTETSGMSHMPTFVSTVAVGTDTYRGAEAKTKKLAEMNAAKVAYCALTKGYGATKSSDVSAVNECNVANNLSQNIQPATTIKKHHDSTDEDHIHTKKSRSSPENIKVESHSEHPSQDNTPSDGSNLVISQEEKSISVYPVNNQTLENQGLLQWKTVVFPRRMNLPIPERASVMPYSDDEWVAYKVGVGNHPTT